MFIYKGSNVVIKLAVDRANSESVHRRLADMIRKESFDMSTANSNYLASEFTKYVKTTDIHVKVYYKRFSKALAYFDSMYPKDININGSKLNRTEGSIVGTFYHEAAHMFDHDDKNHTFGHGDNSSVGKQNTFPYKVGGIIQAIVDESIPDYNNTENRNIFIAIHPWTSIKRFFRRWF